MFNPILGDIVNNVLDVVFPPQSLNKEVDIPQVPLRICVIGKKFSGRQSVAKNLAATFNLQILTADEIIKEAIRYIFLLYKQPFLL
jgi:hypothetical protein